jgi:hypothetical protein
MTPSTVDELLDIPGRSVARNSSDQGQACPLPVRRLIGPAPLLFVTAISLGALAAAVGLSGAADLPSSASATPALNQTSMLEPVKPGASEPPVILRGRPPARTRLP